MLSKERLGRNVVLRGTIFDTPATGVAGIAAIAKYASPTPAQSTLPVVSQVRLVICVVRERVIRPDDV